MQAAATTGRLRALANRVRSIRTWVLPRKPRSGPSTWEPIELNARARVGTVLRGKYRLESVLGVGGMASVYVATHRNRRRFAIKILHPQLSFDTEIRERFQREGWLANSVEHPGVVAVLDDDVSDDGSAFLVMELLDGESVETLWNRRGTLPLRIALALGDQLLDVLQAAHARQVLHRDIKPANLFLRRDGVLKILDFGIARLRATAGPAFTQNGVSLGTPGFMPPEQATGNWDVLGTDADLWAVGATLFSLISGRYVHDGDSLQQQLVQAITQPALPLTTVAPTVPSAVARVIDRALSFRKRDRYASAAAMREALRQAHLEAFGTELDASPQTLSAWLAQREGVGQKKTRERTFVVRRRWLLWTPAVLLMAALLVGFMLQRFQAVYGP